MKSDETVDSVLFNKYEESQQNKQKLKINKSTLFKMIQFRKGNISKVKAISDLKLCLLPFIKFQKFHAKCFLY